MTHESYGMEAGENCNRSDCEGIIEERASESGCSCHINPPCSHCTTPREFCPVCDWHSADDMIMAEGTLYLGVGFAYAEKKPHVWNRSKIDYRTFTHSGCSMKVVGVFPLGTSLTDVEKLVRGTFGGRFERWEPRTGDFVYIAYTD